jgi:hypothetical protein
VIEAFSELCRCKHPHVGQPMCGPLSVYRLPLCWPVVACLTRGDLGRPCLSSLGGSFGGLTGGDRSIGSLSVCVGDLSGWFFLDAVDSSFYSGFSSLFAGGSCFLPSCGGSFPCVFCLEVALLSWLGRPDDGESARRHCRASVDNPSWRGGRRRHGNDDAINGASRGSLLQRSSYLS